MSQTTFSTRETTVVLGPVGEVVAVRHRARPGRSWLELGRPRLTNRADGSLLDVAPVRQLVDADEAELTLADRAGFAITVRHTFAAGWQTRCVLANEGTDPFELDAGLPFTLPPGTVGWAVADGAEAALFVQPDDGRGPLLLGRLRQGAIAAVDGDELRLPPVELQPGARYVLAWDWSWLSTPVEYVRRWSSLHPAVTTMTRGETVALTAGPDVALVIPDGLLVERDEDLIEIGSDEPRRATVELRSARGVTTIPLAWTPTAAELLAHVAADQLAGPRGPVGVVALSGLAEALVVQHAVRAELVDDADDAADALDQFTARLDPQRPESSRDEPRQGASSPDESRRGQSSRGAAGESTPGLVALYLCGEHERTGDQTLLESAVEQVLAAQRPAPALGIAASRICAALLAIGDSPVPVLQRVIMLAGDPGPDAELATLTELRMITRRTGERGARSEPEAELVDAVLALGTALGSGLPGDSVRELPVDRLGQLLVTLAALPDEVAEPTRQVWGVPAADLAARRLPTLIDRLVGQPVGLGHVWLALLAGTD